MSTTPNKWAYISEAESECCGKPLRCGHPHFPFVCDKCGRRAEGVKKNTQWSCGKCWQTVNKSEGEAIPEHFRTCPLRKNSKARVRVDASIEIAYSSDDLELFRDESGHPERMSMNGYQLLEEYTKETVSLAIDERLVTSINLHNVRP